MCVCGQQIQKRVRGFFGHRKAAVVKEELARRRQTTKIQATWRGLQGRRRAESTRVEVGTKRVREDAVFLRAEICQERYGFVQHHLQTPSRLAMQTVFPPSLSPSGYSPRVTATPGA